jgi:hypothetical protein
MIGPGTILVEETTARPQCLELEDSSHYATSWVPVKPTHAFQEFERELWSAGWTFFHMANAVSAISFGFDRARMTQVAVQRLIAKVREQRCNCFEVDDVALHSFLGMQYVRISAHPRHIQQGMVFTG